MSTGRLDRLDRLGGLATEEDDGRMGDTVP